MQVPSFTKRFAPLLVALAVAAPASATDFSALGAYWNTDAAGDTAGATLGFGIPFNDSLALELRASYFEELSDDPLANAFDSDDPVFQDKGIQAIPLEAGLRFSFAPGQTFRPHIGAGGSYFLLDSDFGEVKDELGYYAVLGATIGDGEGADFLIEGTWRKVSAQVELDPEQLDDIDDIDVQEKADLDLDGVGVNLGVRWSF